MDVAIRAAALTIGNAIVAALVSPRQRFIDKAERGFPNASHKMRPPFGAFGSSSKLVANTMFMEHNGSICTAIRAATALMKPSTTDKMPHFCASI